MSPIGTKLYAVKKSGVKVCAHSSDFLTKKTLTVSFDIVQ
jgi:hypothetical protein